MADIDDQIDRLYREPLDAFVQARNALAKATGHAGVKALPKPSLPAWTINQLYWHRRPVLDQLVAAADTLRREHGRALAGKPANVHLAERAHEDAVRHALAEARAVLADGGHAATPATLDAVRDTLRALPSPEANGRLARALAPRGLEALAGLALAPRPALRIVATRRETSASEEAARARAAEAEREVRERLRAAERAEEDARAALRRAETALDDAERVAERRRRERDAAAAAHARAEHAVRALRR